MAKKVQAYIKLQVKAAEANPSPPIGPALGQHGIKIMDFCKAFNAKTQSMEAGTPIPTIITVYSDKSFSFLMKTAPASFYLKKISGNNNAVKDKTSHDETCKFITFDQLKEIAVLKKPNLTASNLHAAVRTIAGTARSMGLKIVENK